MELSYDDRPGDIWMNGTMVPWKNAQVHVLSHAMHYASAVFEGIRAYDGRIFKLTEHNERLLAGTETMDMKMSTPSQKWTLPAGRFWNRRDSMMPICARSYGAGRR